MGQNLPVSRYREIFEGYSEHLEDDYDHLRQQGVPGKELEELRQELQRGVPFRRAYGGDIPVIEASIPACSDRWLEEVLKGEVNVASGAPEDHAEAHTLAAEGTREAVDTALDKEEDVFHIGGGHHHAHTGGSSDPSFNMINDLAAGVEAARDRFEEGYDPRVLVVDLDLHFGDGTISIYRSDEDVFHFSMHEWNNFPQVDSGWLDYTGSGEAEGTKVNLPLPTGLGGEKYCEVLEELLPQVVEEANPDLVLYQAGVDVHHADELGGLELSREDIYRRDRAVVEETGDIPLVVTTGGGYESESHRGKASTNTMAALVGEEMIHDEDAESPGSSMAADRLDEWYSQLTQNSELDFLK